MGINTINNKSLWIAFFILLMINCYEEQRNMLIAEDIRNEIYQAKEIQNAVDRKFLTKEEFYDGFDYLNDSILSITKVGLRPVSRHSFLPPKLLDQ